VYSLNDVVAASESRCYAVGNAYPAGSEDGRAVVYEYADGKLKYFFVSPYDGSGFDDAEFELGAGELWLVGYKRTGKEHMAPYVVEYVSHEWRELEVPSSVSEMSLKRVIPIIHTQVFFLGDDKIYAYDGQGWRVALSFPKNTYLYFTRGAGRSSHYLYAYAVPPGAASAFIYVSDDFGVSWHAEPVKLKEGAFRQIKFDWLPEPIAAAGDSLFVHCFLTAPGTHFTYEGLVRRRPAPPGAGTYELAFLSPPNPYFWRVTTMAYLSANNGFAVGSRTSVRLIGRSWITEIIGEDEGAFTAIDVAGGTFWATRARAQGNPESLWRAR